MMAGASMLLGAGSAAGTLVIARAADSQALLKEEVDVAHAGLTGEARQQLGNAE